MVTKKIHSFGTTDPNAECYRGWNTRTPICGRQVKKEYVTNIPENVTCKRCLKLEKLR